MVKFKVLVPMVLFIVTFILMLKVLFLGGYPDFNAYYYGAIGNNILFYPPFVAVLFLVFSYLPITLASMIWVNLSIIFLLVSLYLCFKLFNIKMFSSTALILSSLVFIYFPVKFTLGMGQINLLIFLLIVLTLYFYIKGKDIYSGVCLGISIMLKLFPPLLLIYFILKKKYKIVFCAIAVFVSLGGLSYLFIKPEINNYYWLHLFSVVKNTSNYSYYYNQALSGFLLRQFSDVFQIQLLKIFITLFLIAVSFFTLLKGINKKSSKKTLEFGFIITLSVFINGYAWQHHFVWLILPFLLTFFYIKGNKLKPIYYLILGVSYLLVASNLKNPSLFPVIIQSHVFFGAVLLWALNEYLLLKK